MHNISNCKKTVSLFGRRLGITLIPEIVASTVLCNRVLKVRQRKKGKDLTQSYDKSPYTNRYAKRAK